MKGYAVIDTADVRDRALFDEYVERVPPVVESHGGRYLVRGGAMESVQGDWRPGRLVVVEFDSVERARAWQESPDYAELRRLLNASSDTSVILVEGV